MICPKCKKETKKAQFCESCGENLEPYFAEQKNKKLKIKYRIAVVEFLVFVCLLVLVIVGNVYFGGSNFKSFQLVSEETNTAEPVRSIADENDLIVETAEYSFELTEENKNEDLDEDGLTNEEEVALGTYPMMEDSDGDGLTDGEEVNYYNSNPLKSSTADDGISDYAKVKKGLDVNTVYDESTMTFEDNKVNSKVTLKPRNLISEVAGTFKYFSKDNTVNSLESVFSVYNFEGQIEYKLDKVDVKLLVAYGGEYTEFDDYTIDADKMIINIDEDDNAIDFVIVTTENYEAYLEGGND